jgi:hypothetical protein
MSSMCRIALRSLTVVVGLGLLLVLSGCAAGFVGVILGLSSSWFGIAYLRGGPEGLSWGGQILRVIHRDPREPPLSGAAAEIRPGPQPGELIGPPARQLSRAPFPGQSGTLRRSGSRRRSPSGQLARTDRAKLEIACRL